MSPLPRRDLAPRRAQSGSPRHLRSATRTMSSKAIHSARKRARLARQREAVVHAARIGDALGGQDRAATARDRDRRTPRSWNSTTRAWPSATRSCVATPGTSRRAPRRPRRRHAGVSTVALRPSRRRPALVRRASRASRHAARETGAGSHRRRGPTRAITASTGVRARTAARRSPAIAPNITALTTVPASRAAASMSNATSARLCRRATSSSSVGIEAAIAERPSFPRSSACGCVDVTSSVRSGLVMPACTTRTGLEQLGGDHEIDAAGHRQQAQARARVRRGPRRGSG